MNESKPLKATPARTSKLRIILLSVVAVLALVVTCVVMAPTLLSWGFLRGTVLSAISGSVNGTVTVDTLNLGWLSGVEVRGLVIDDPASGNRVQLDLRSEQGLWRLLTGGISDLDATVGGSVKTRREADGSLSIARLVRTSEATAPVAGAQQPAKTGAAAISLPAGLDVRVTIPGITFEILEASGAPYAAVKSLAGSAHVQTGGDISAKVSAQTQMQGVGGSVDIALSAPKLFDAAGALRLTGTPLDLKIKASDTALKVRGISIRMSEANVLLKSSDLTGALEADIAVRVTLDEQSPTTLKSLLRFDRLFTADGAPIFDLSAIHGSFQAEALPTAPFQNFVESRGIVLARDIGPRVDLDATFADATGGALKVALKSEAVSLQAEGAVDATTGAAQLSLVELDAKLAPELLSALADIGVSQPASFVVRATNIGIPKSAADGSFPIADLQFDGSVALTLANLAVPSASGRVPLDVTQLRASVKALPVSAGVSLEISADTSAPASATPLRVSARVQQGGAFGAFGSVQASQIPCALLRPFMPKDFPVDLEKDVGTVITQFDASLTKGDSPSFTTVFAAGQVSVKCAGKVAADRSLQIDRDALIQLRAVRPALVAMAGVQVDAPVAVTVSLNSLTLPPPEAFQLQKLAVDAGINVSRSGGGAVKVSFGSGSDLRSVQVESMSATVKSASLGESVQVMVDVRADGMKAKLQADAAGLKTFAATDIDAAEFVVTAEVSGIAAQRVVQEVPAIKDILPKVGSGVFDASVHYHGSLWEGKGGASVKSGSTALALIATLARDSLAAEATLGADISKALLDSVATMPVQVSAPFRVDVAVNQVTLKRSAQWVFVAPTSTQATLRIPNIRVSQISGVAGDVVLSDLAAVTDLKLAEPMSVQGTLNAALGAVRGSASQTPLAPLASHFSYHAPSHGKPMNWSADVVLEGIKADGLAALLDLDAEMRKEIGNSARIAVKAESAALDSITFELASTLARMKADVKGQLQAGMLSIANSSADITIPAAQATELLNSFAAKPDANGKKPAPVWKDSSAITVRAMLKSVRMQLGAGASAAVPTATDGNASSAPRITLPKGFAAEMSVDLKPFTLTATAGDRVTVDEVSVAVDAPGLEKPASLRATAMIQGEGNARIPISLVGSISDWANADGAVLVDRMRVDATMKAPKASTQVVGTLLGMGPEFAEAVGPDITVDASVVSSGPGAGTLTASVAGKYFNASIPQVALKDGMLDVVNAKPAVLDFIPSEPVRRRYLASINPIFRDIRLADEKKPIRFTVEKFTYPIDGNYAKISGDLRLVVGDVLLEKSSDNAVLNVLDVFQNKDKKPVEGVIEPLVVEIRKGQLTYKDFVVGIERQGKSWKTRLIFDGDIDLTRDPPFARAIAANYPIGSVAREVVGVLPNEDGGGSIANTINTLSLGVGDAVQLRIKLRGPLGDVNGKPSVLERKVKIIFDPKAVSGGIEGLGEKIGEGIGDLFGGKKGGKKKPPQGGGK